MLGILTCAISPGHHEEALRLKQQPDGTTQVEDMIIRRVKCADDVTAVLAEADQNRSVAATAMNMHSSRSHLVLQITVSGILDLGLILFSYWGFWPGISCAT